MPLLQFSSRITPIAPRSHRRIDGHDMNPDDLHSYEMNITSFEVAFYCCPNAIFYNVSIQLIISAIIRNSIYWLKASWFGSAWQTNERVQMMNQPPPWSAARQLRGSPSLRVHVHEAVHLLPSAAASNRNRRAQSPARARLGSWLEKLESCLTLDLSGQDAGVDTANSVLTGHLTNHLFL
jgi:hypothetical protein